MLSNFKFKKIKKNKLKKTIKRFLFLLNPLTKSILFLLKNSDTKIFDISLPAKQSDEPSVWFLSRKVSDVSEIYIRSALYTLTRSTLNLNLPTGTEADKNGTAIDLEFTTRLYSIISAFFVFIFFVIKKKGRKRLVG